LIQLLTGRSGPQLTGRLSGGPGLRGTHRRMRMGRDLVAIQGHAFDAARAAQWIARAAFDADAPPQVGQREGIDPIASISRSQ
jgi:hypothetical protein